MDAFTDAQSIEDIGRAIFEKRFSHLFDFQTDMETQLNGIDYVAKKDPSLTFDLKVDGTKYHNIFVEEWSNLNVRQGWLHTSRATGILYLFHTRNVMYGINLQTLRHYMKEHGDEYPLKHQNKYQQRNVTCGRPVPIAILEREGVIGHTWHFKLT